MNDRVAAARTVRFGLFECDLQTGELRKSGRKVRLADQPFRVLAELVGRPGEIVTRQELQERLWPGQPYGEFNDGVNTAVNKLRAALEDNADNPRFVETIPRRGYRFVAGVQAQEWGAGNGHAATPEPMAGVKPRAAPRLRRWPERVTIAAAIGTGLFAVWWFNPLPPPRVTHTDQVTPDSRIDLPVKPVTVGRHVYYLERAGDHWDLMRTWVGEGDGQRVQGPGWNPVVMDVSPDGLDLLVASGSGPQRTAHLWRMPTAGGGAVPLVRAATGAVFSPDGKQIAYTWDKALWVMDSNGGRARNLVEAPGATSWPAWSPDGRRLRFTVGEPFTGHPTSLWEVSSQGKNLRQLLVGWSRSPSECCGSWTRDGRYYVFTSSHGGSPNLWVLRERGSFWRRSPRGPFELTDGPDTPWGGAPARDGRRIFYYNGLWQEDMQELDPRTGQFAPFRPAGASMPAAFSRDGAWIAYNSADGSLYRSRVDGTDQVELAPARFNPSWPRWSPDGKWIAFGIVRASEPAKSFVVPAAGGAPQPLFPSDRDMRDADWSSGGRRLVVTTGAGPKASGQSDLVIVDFATRRTSQIPGSENLAMCRWSPDGRWIAATAGDHTALKLWDASSKGKLGWRVVARGAGLGISVWSPDSRYLYFQDLLAKGEPVLRYDVPRERIEPVAEFSGILASGVARAALFGITPQGSPVIGLGRNFYSLFTAKVSLP